MVEVNRSARELYGDSSYVVSLRRNEIHPHLVLTFHQTMAVYVEGNRLKLKRNLHGTLHWFPASCGEFVINDFNIFITIESNFCRLPWRLSLYQIEVC